MRKRGRQAAGAPGGGVPTPQATQLTVQKAKLPKKKQTPDPSIGDDPGEFIKWVKLLLGLKPTAAGATQRFAADPAAPTNPQPTQDALDAEAKAYTTLTNAVKTFLGGDQDLLRATKAIWDYLKAYSRNPQLRTPEGKAAFAQFTANLKVVYKLVNWLNWMVKWGHSLKEVPVVVGKTASKENQFMNQRSKHPSALNVNGVLYKRCTAATAYSDGSPLRPRKFNLPSDMAEWADTHNSPVVPDPQFKVEDTPALRELAKYFWQGYKEVQLTKLPSMYGLGQTGLQLEQWAIMFQNEMGLSTPEMEELWQYLISVRWATASAFRSWRALLRRYELSPVRTPTYTKTMPRSLPSNPVAKAAAKTKRQHSERR